MMTLDCFGIRSVRRYFLAQISFKQLGAVIHQGFTSETEQRTEKQSKQTTSLCASKRTFMMEGCAPRWPDCFQHSQSCDGGGANPQRPMLLHAAGDDGLRAPFFRCMGGMMSQRPTGLLKITQSLLLWGQSFLLRMSHSRSRLNWFKVSSKSCMPRSLDFNPASSSRPRKR